MKARLVFCMVAFSVFSLLFASVAAFAQQTPKEPIAVKLEGAKMPPVTFSHQSHVDKAKIACVKCHHKDPDAPKACVTCHGVKQAKDKAPLAKEAFHTQCITCHKESAAKGVKAPTKCNECHKK
ncbi:MAG: Acidic cytochrome c3 precursor [Syntrophorhabdaceae bacterium PtaU1.Bin034]|nr:MAG: Acidic cytochrome c3 precursor [Syntrophorhabdaceae bacterium PtaU1.Bin034]